MSEYIDKQELMQWLDNNPNYSIELPSNMNDAILKITNMHHKMIMDGVDKLPTLTEQEVIEIMQQLWKKQGAVEFATKLKERACADKDYGLIVSEKMIDNLLLSKI